MHDSRRQDRIVYSQANLIWSGILIFLLGLESRRQFRFESTTPSFVRNLNVLSGTSVETAPHDDTINEYLKNVRQQDLRELPQHAVRHLIRMKTLDPWRLHGNFLVAIDGTGQLFFRKPHCPYCLTQKASNGETLYFHHVLEAKLVTANGMVFSMATEFIENRDPKATKQDCEIKAFRRLSERLKTAFPQLPILLLGDALYACAPVLAICEKNRWGLIATFKRGQTPSLFAEFETLKRLQTKNRVTCRQGKEVQSFVWVNDLKHEGHTVSAFECRESSPVGPRYFAWITNLPVGCTSVIHLANQGGRLRWKIENEGFNTQKHHGYNLEHAYSTHDNAAKGFYFLLQVAHAINQLMIKGSLLKNFDRILGSLKNFYRRLAEAFRFSPIDPGTLDGTSGHAYQIRFDSS